MKLNWIILLLLFACACPGMPQTSGVPQWALQTNSAPTWLQYLGSAIDGPFTVPTTGGFSGSLGQSYSVPASSPYTVTPTVPGSGVWSADAGVSYASTGVQLTPVASGPTVGQYSVSAGVYTFAAADEGAALLISFLYTTPGSTVSALTGDFYFTSFTIPAGATLTTSGLTVHSIGACVVNGTLNAIGGGIGGGSGGGGGGGSAAGYPGSNSALSPFDAAGLLVAPMAYGVPGGQYGLGSGGAGSAGQFGFDSSGSPGHSNVNGAVLNAHSTAFREFVSTGGGTDGLGVGGASGGAGGGSTAQGGAPGGGIVLICGGGITGSGTINVSGTAGANATANNTGAGGGGGGGGIILSSQPPITFTGVVSIAGGAGGTCGSYSGCGPGGAGGVGWVAAFSGWGKQ